MMMMMDDDDVNTFVLFKPEILGPFLFFVLLPNYRVRPYLVVGIA